MSAGLLVMNQTGLELHNDTGTQSFDTKTELMATSEMMKTLLECNQSVDRSIDRSINSTCTGQPVSIGMFKYKDREFHYFSLSVDSPFDSLIITVTVTRGIFRKYHNELAYSYGKKCTTFEADSASETLGIYDIRHHESKIFL